MSQNNHQIIFKDGKVEYVNEFTYNRIFKDSCDTSNSSFVVGNNRYEFKDIRRMKEPKRRDIFDISSFVKNRTPASRIKAIESIAKGLKKYIESSRYRGTQAPKILLERMRVIYEQAKATQ